MNYRMLIRNVHIVDVAKGSIRRSQSVLVQDGRIEEILDIPPEISGDLIDAKDSFLCPGLIDCHVHFFLDASSSPLAHFMEDDEQTKMTLAHRNAELAISAGITTVRDCGAPAALMFEFQRQAERGDLLGPHIMSCGASLTRPKGHCNFFGGEVSSAEDVRRRIEEQLRQGAKFVKLIASGGGLTPGTHPSEADMPLEWMRAAAETAHANGVHVTAHCHATESILRAIDAGLDMIEHVSFVEPPGRYRFDEAVAQRLQNAGVVLSPTVYGALRTAQRFRESGQVHNQGDLGAIERLEGRLTNTGHFHRLGAKIIGGTDAGVTDTPFNTLADELASYVQAGMSNGEALRTVTSDSAKFMNLPQLGEVLPGYRADLILLRKNPLQDLDSLRRPWMVIKSGKVVHQAASRLPAN